ncbi:tagatose-6-phosphate ketose/aldose isomerase [Friedmanniella endophytica]|uniref:Tagatose-6-phosphate ketose/aldose isomerase n=1 Tax=Microlunatus kandeliicorticis TaxID=1759536 RepID=A0A7W3IVV0_9ACTN|nr:SIS domain-containing protein [Microlunatus kandeliicorticis]MBA8796060.1 tagatose-6-phosphate ketose/aldose isomerase [Microlunatus kandeliicorticis]
MTSPTTQAATTTGSEPVIGAGALGGPEVATAREIAQQPAVWRQVGRDHAEHAAERAAFLAPLLADARTRIVLTGAGTSAFAGRVLAPSLSRELARRVEAVPTTDIVSNPREVFADDVPTLLVSFARSGDSPESVAATELAEQCLTSVAHLIITCNPGGELASRHHPDAGPRDGSLVVLMPPATNDTGFAMTSSFTSMVLGCWLTLTGAAEPAALADRLAIAVEPLLADPSPVTALAARDYARVVYLGSGGLAGLAQEGALKLLELTAGRTVSFHDSSLGFRHGPKAVLDDATLVIAFRSDDAYTARYDDDIAAELVGAVGSDHVLRLTARTDGPAGEHDLVLPGLEGLDDAVLAVPFAVAVQLFALACSVRAGLTPDNPFPGGQVNRVVQGVTIHPLEP